MKLPPKKSDDEDPPTVPVVPPQDPIPNFGQSSWPKFSSTTKKWLTIGSIVLGMLGACATTVGKVYQDLNKPPPPSSDTAWRKELEDLEAHLKRIEERQNKHIEACQTFRNAVGAAWRTHPQGEVIIRGVNQDAYRLWSESLNPPVHRVSDEVKPLPDVPK